MLNETLLRVDRKNRNERNNDPKMAETMQNENF
jgi:hypothetical protein